MSAMSVMSDAASDYRYCPLCAMALTVTIQGVRERRTCPSGHWTHWDNPLPVLAALVEIDGKVLLARNAAWPEKMFALVTGFMERGETPEQGIARELKEETSLEVQSIALIGVYEFIHKNEVILAYHVQAVGQIQLSEELIEYRLVAPEQLRPWRAGTGYAVADWLQARGLRAEFIDLPPVKPQASDFVT